MTRRDKYPDTRTFVFYNANDKDRMGNDCVVRAIATVLAQSWEQTVREMTEIGIQKGYVLSDKPTIDAYLQSKGFTKHKQPRKPDGKKYTGSEFCLQLAKGRRIVAKIGSNHVVAIVNDMVHDIRDCTGRCIGNYWSREK